MHLPRLWTDASVAIQKLKGRKLITGKGCAHIQHRPPHKCALSLTQVLLAQVSKAPVDHLARCLVASRAQLLAEFAPRRNRRPRYDRKWPPCHNASPLCAQNSHRTAPQQETTIRSKMATVPQRQPTLCTKFAPRHNRRPRYDRKWPPRHKPAHFAAPQRETTSRSKIISASHAHTQSQRPPPQKEQFILTL